MLAHFIEESITFTRTELKASPVSDGTLLVAGIQVSSGEEMFVSTLVVRVGNESIEVGLLTGFSSSTDPTTPPDNLTLAGTLNHLEVILAGQPRLITSYDLSSVLHT